MAANQPVKNSCWISNLADAYDRAREADGRFTNMIEYLSPVICKALNVGIDMEYAIIVMTMPIVRHDKSVQVAAGNAKLRVDQSVSTRTF